MIKPPISLQELRRKIYVKAKSENQWRFWGLYTHICKQEVLREAYTLAKRNKGSPGSDGVTFEAIEASGVEPYLADLRADLLSKRYQPGKARKVYIGKADGKSRRELSIPSIRDRIVQGAVKLILEPIFEADFQEGSYGYRPKRHPAKALDQVKQAMLQNKIQVIDLDISKFFDTVRHNVLLEKIAQRVQDKEAMRLVKQILKSTGKLGLPQGGPLSPLLSNIYLNSIDKMLERAKQMTKTNGYTNLDYARWADDMVILIDNHKKHQWLTGAVLKRLNEEFNKLGLAINQEKTKIVNLKETKQSFSFLGFDLRLTRSRQGKRWTEMTPRRNARIRFQREIKAIFRAKRGRPIKEVIDLINPKLQGWINYFRIGNSANCFSVIKMWVEKKVRRHIRRSQKQEGFGWKRWSTSQIYSYTGLYNDYRVQWYQRPKAP